MRKPSRIECILNGFGWKSVNGKVEYRGFEHLLNADLSDWRAEEPEEEPPTVEIAAEVAAAKEPINLVVDPKVAAAMVRNQEAHKQLISAQRRVDVLKKIKDKVKQK